MAEHALAYAPDGWRVRMVAVVSPEDAADGEFIGRLKEIGVSVYAFPNSPLSMKWQAGLSMVRYFYPKTDAVFILGSDDFCSRGYMDSACAMLDDGETLPFGRNHVHMLNAETGALAAFEHGNKLLTLGAGRVFPRKSLDALDWVLWVESIEKGLDNSSSTRCERADMPIKVAHLDGFVVDVKSENMHPWEKFEARNGFARIWNQEDAARVLRKNGLDIVIDLGSKK